MQLREKESSTRAFIALAKELKQLLSPFKVPLFINDRIDVALAANADGVHLGDNDIPFEDARRILNAHVRIGLTINNLDDIDQYNQYPLAYLGVSALYKSAVKQDIEHLWTADEIFQLKSRTRHLLIGVGGITVQNTAEVLRYGLDGIAVSSAICAQPTSNAVSRVTKNLIRQLNL